MSRVKNMENMFYHASAFNGDISKWDVLWVTNMAQMFNGATSFNRDISNWAVSRVTDMGKMFKGASSFTQTLCGEWITSTADKHQMFDGSSGSICTTTSTPASNSKTTSVKVESPTLTNPPPWLRPKSCPAQKP